MLDAWDALNTLDEMIREEAQIAAKMAIAFPDDFSRLSASAGTGIRLTALMDARSRIRTTYAKRLENESAGE